MREVANAEAATSRAEAATSDAEDRADRSAGIAANAVADSARSDAARMAAEARAAALTVELKDYEQTKTDLGVTLFQGYWFAKPVLVTGQTIRPSQAVIIQLINLVRKQATTAEIEEILKRDASLSFNLLRFINSSGFGLSCEITSFRHAVMILGLKKLFRWAALLLTTSRAGGVPAAVGVKRPMSTA
jgi:EAL and modified HD-GYP domain-containing signal transduction protein